mgnify:CR=1 FL=1
MVADHDLNTLLHCEPTDPQVLIIVPLARVFAPLNALVRHLFRPEQVRVVLHQGSVGQSVNVIHNVRCSRYVDKDDQWLGIQKDPARSYVTCTRARLRYYGWMEGQLSLIHISEPTRPY